MPGGSAASPNKADNLRSAAVQSLLKIEPDFISAGMNRFPPEINRFSIFAN
jgi:hypothetical protein